MKKSQLKELIKAIVRESMTTRTELDAGLMKAVNVEEQEEKDLNEMSSTGAAAGYSTPFAFTKNKKGSPRGIEAAKKYGKVVGESPRV